MAGMQAGEGGRGERDLDFHQVFSVLQSPAKLHGSCLLALEIRGIGFLSAYLLPIISPGSEIQMFTAPPAALMSLQSYYVYFFVCLFLAPWVSLRKRCRCFFSILWRTRNRQWQGTLDKAIGLKRCSALDIRGLWPLALPASSGWGMFALSSVSLESIWFPSSNTRWVCDLDWLNIGPDSGHIVPGTAPRTKAVRISYLPTRDSSQGDTWGNGAPR